MLANGTAARRREASAERRGTGLFDALYDPDEAAGPDVGEELVGEPGDVMKPTCGSSIVGRCPSKTERTFSLSVPN